MSVCEIVLHQKDNQGEEGTLTVSDLIRSTRRFNHATKRDLDHLLENPHLIPEEITSEAVPHRKVALFCGSIETDHNDNKYVMALYHDKQKGFLSGRYWLKDPISSDFYLTLIQ